MADISLQTQILSLLRDGRGVIIEAAPDQAAPNRDWAPGQSLQARVASKLPDGRALIEVEGTLFQVRLPERIDAPVGQRLALTVVRAGPEPTFLLQRTPDMQAGPTSATEVRLSNLATRVASLLGAPAGTTASPVTQSAPLLSAPPSSGGALVAPLRQAFETSGMFYESHQAEWVGGKRPLETLRQEPQARIAREVSNQRPALAGPAMTHVEPDVIRTDQGGAAPATSRAGPHADLAALPPGLAGIVDRQLDALSTQQIVWQGQVWPGQSMQWQVEEREAGREADEAQSRWRTHLRLELPRLGAVAARLDLTGDTLRLVVDANGGDAIVASLRAGEGELARMLEARGLRLDGFQVNEDDGV